MKIVYLANIEYTGNNKALCVLNSQFGVSFYILYPVSYTFIPGIYDIIIKDHLGMYIAIAKDDLAIHSLNGYVVIFKMWRQHVLLQLTE